MQEFPLAFQKLVRELSKLPTIGEKTATRLAYHLVQADRALTPTLSAALVEAAEKVQLCESCFFLSEEPQCRYCTSTSRDTTRFCVVEKPMDVIAVERSGEFRGLYHVLHGLWAPLRGQGPESMKLQELLKRVSSGDVEEVILATNSTVEGDATAVYIGQLLQEKGIRSTRLAQGMPKGGELEYADEVTLARAFAGRGALSGS